MMSDDTRARWRKSSYSGGNNPNCVELTCSPTSAIRDSKNLNGPSLEVDFSALVAELRAGREFDR